MSDKDSSKSESVLGENRERSTARTGTPASRLIVGEIAPQPEQGPRPLFVIHRNDRPWEPALPGCAHGSFRLNTEWLTVTCGECGEKIEPFAALMVYATCHEKMVKMSKDLEWQRIGVLRERLRAIQDRVALDRGDRMEIRNACMRTGKDTTVENLTALLDRLADKIRAAKVSKRPA